MVQVCGHCGRSTKTYGSLSRHIARCSVALGFSRRRVARDINIDFIEASNSAVIDDLSYGSIKGAGELNSIAIDDDFEVDEFSFSSVRFTIY